MRLEQVIAKALKNVNNDRYVLSVAVGQRADELSKGAKPLIPDARNYKYTDIAIMEIAQGLLKIDSIVKKRD